MAAGADIRARRTVLGLGRASGRRGRGRPHRPRPLRGRRAWCWPPAPGWPTSRPCWPVSPCRSGRCSPGCSRSGRELFAPDALPGVQPGGRGGALLRPAGLGGAGLQARPLPPPRRAERRRTRCGARWTRRTSACCAASRNATSRTAPARRWRLRACMFTNTPGRALRPRPPPGVPAGRPRLPLLGPRLQILLRDGRDPGRPGERGATTAARHRVPPLGASRIGAPGGVRPPASGEGGSAWTKTGSTCRSANS